MSLRLSRRFLLLQLLIGAAFGCNARTSPSGSLVIGIISYEAGKQIIDRYARFKRYLGETLKVHVEIEPAFNEIKALERIKSQAWSLVFAPPGVAAIAIADYQYRPCFPQQNYAEDLRSILVVRKDSPIQSLGQLAGKPIALGLVGSATGYYFPIFNLYGLTLAEVLFAPTPQTVLTWVAQGKAVAGALSKEEFDRYHTQVESPEFRILYIDSHRVPPGVVLLGPTIERTYEERILKVMRSVSPVLAQEAGYVPNGTLPNYEYMLSVVKRVRAISAHLHKKPARLLP